MVGRCESFPSFSHTRIIRRGRHIPANMILVAVILLSAVVVNSQEILPVGDYPHQNYRGLNYRNPYNYYDETPKPYSFNYNAPLDYGGESSRTEVADGSGRVEGSYTVTNDEGHTRVVDYVADEGGFRANVRTNEPGTESKNPADVTIDSAAPMNYSPYQYNAGLRRPDLAVDPAAPLAPGLRRAGLPLGVDPAAPLAPGLRRAGLPLGVDPAVPLAPGLRRAGLPLGVDPAAPLAPGLRRAGLPAAVDPAAPLAPAVGPDGIVAPGQPSLYNLPYSNRNNLYNQYYGNQYNRNPYNRDPYNRDAYNRDPYNRDPYNRDAYNRDPYVNPYY